MTQVHFDRNVTRYDELQRRFDRIDARLSHIGETMLRRSDLFRSVLLAQGAGIVLGVGVLVILDALVGFAG